MLRKGKLCFVLLFLVLFYWPSPAQSHTDLFPIDKIGSITINLPPRGDQPVGDEADVYFPVASATKYAFPVVAVLQGAGVDKVFYSNFGTQLARYGFVVVIPNHLVNFGPPGTPPLTPFPDEFVILDVLAQMEEENTNPDLNSPLFGIVDTTRMGLAGHSAGGAASLFAIDRSCQFPFCGPPDPPFPLPFPLPDAVRAGAFYGTNTCGAGGDAGEDPACIDEKPTPPTPPNLNGEIFGINNENIPVAIVQGSVDGISAPAEGQATFDILDDDGVRALIPILNEKFGANHYGITDVNNPPAVFPNFIPPTPDPNTPTIPQEESIQEIADATGRFLRTHVGIDLSVSSATDRSDTKPLEGATLSGKAYIFLTPLYPDGDIEQVDFFLDGSFVKTEFWAPYDLKGTYRRGNPAPFDTRTLKDGSHTVRAEIVFPSGVQSIESEFITRNYESKPSAFRLSVSFSPDRSGTIPLEGVTLSGDAFIFLTPLFPDGDIDEVDFFLDGLFVKTESWAPYDLKGTRDGGIPAPFDTRRLDNGPHIVRAEIEFSAGEVEAVASKFSVFNDSDSDDDDDDDDD